MEMLIIAPRRSLKTTAAPSSTCASLAISSRPVSAAAIHTGRGMSVAMHVAARSHACILSVIIIIVKRSLAIICVVSLAMLRVVVVLCSSVSVRTVMPAAQSTDVKISASTSTAPGAALWRPVRMGRDAVDDLTVNAIQLSSRLQLLHVGCEECCLLSLLDSYAITSTL